MSKISSASKIKLKSYDDLFSGANAEQNVPEQEIKRIPINLLHDFQHHPFKIKEDDRFYEMVDSIKKYGVLVPGLARPRAEGGYEIVAGHTRLQMYRKSSGLIILEQSTNGFMEQPCQL